MMHMWKEKFRNNNILTASTMIQKAPPSKSGSMILYSSMSHRHCHHLDFTAFMLPLQERHQLSNTANT